jgi:hypothetical protein
MTGPPTVVRGGWPAVLVAAAIAEAAWLGFLAWLAFR